MRLADGNHVIQQFATAAADPALLCPKYLRFISAPQGGVRLDSKTGSFHQECVSTTSEGKARPRLLLRISGRARWLFYGACPGPDG